MDAHDAAAAEAVALTDAERAERTAALDREAAAARDREREAAVDRARQRVQLADAAAAAVRAASDAEARVRAATAALDREREAASALAQAAVSAQQHAARANASDVDGGHGAPPPDAASLEALAVANLHAQAAGVQNIRSLVSVVLELSSPHYNQWRDLVLLTLGRYSLADHVTSDVVVDTPAWHRMDCVVLSWIYGTVSTKLMDLIHVRGSSARSAWLGIEHNFLGHRETRALLLDAEFRTIVQGNLSVTDYCRKMKSMADALADLGEYVPDRTLVLNVLRGLSEKYAYMTPHFKRQRPFPTFSEVRDDLLLEELTMPAALPTPSSALIATAGKNSGAPPRQPAQGGGNNQGRRNNRRRGSGNRGSNGGNGGGGSGGPNNAAAAGKGTSSLASGQPGPGHAGTHWPSFFNPWTGTISMWPRPQPTPPGGSAPRLAPSVGYSAPQAGYPAPQAMLAGPFGFPPPAPVEPGPLLPASPAPSAPWTPWSSVSWDQQALANAFSTMSVQPPATGEWVMDSGASSHMTPDTGSSFQERDRQVQ
ncbi:uncharacterized protein [Setaria viridis]|uniref:uncharacterized protein n=1 Tax=Setaria viridis TaxID=4556 RepID=UPI0014936F6D|nr:uncharacterized protein LOC117848155 [Setaria viridis]